MHLQVVALGDGADDVEEALAAGGARLHVDHHVGLGQAGAHGFFHLVRDGVDALEGQRAGDADGEVNEVARAGAARADALNAHHARHARDRGFDLSAQAGGRRVQQHVHRALAQPQADPDHNAGHDQRGDGVGGAERLPTQPLARQHAQQAEDDHRARPDIGAEVERIGFERLRVVLAGDAVERAGAEVVDHDADRHHAERPQAGLDVDVFEEQAARGFPDNPGAGQEQQAGFNESGEVFDFAVAVLMIGVSGPVGDAHGEVGDAGGDEVEPGVRGFGEHAQAVGGKADHGFERHQQQRRQQAGEGDAFLFALGLLESELVGRCAQVNTGRSPRLLILQESVSFGRARPGLFRKPSPAARRIVPAGG